jgi:hypothetical protein
VREYPYNVDNLHVEIVGDGLSGGRVGMMIVFVRFVFCIIFIFLKGKKVPLVSNFLTSPMERLSLQEVRSISCEYSVESILMISSETFAVTVLGPNGVEVPSTIHYNENGTCDVSYSPLCLGEHKVALRRRGGTWKSERWIIAIRGVDLVFCFRCGEGSRCPRAGH